VPAGGAIVPLDLTGCAQHTYAVLDERVPPGLTYEADEALAELAFRFFAGHGPASLKDFIRWSSLTVFDARASIAAVGDRQLWTGSPCSSAIEGDRAATL
jgi:hypothetical protein